MFKLKHKETTLGELEIIGSDQPWFLGSFKPFKEFEEHRKFFTDYQKDYYSSKEDWDTFFKHPEKAGYSLKSDDSEFTRYILVWEEDDKVRLRGQKKKLNQENHNK